MEHNEKINFTIFGNQKFYKIFQPMIDELVKAKAINWREDLYMSNDIPKGFVYDVDAERKMELGGSMLRFINRDKLEIIYPEFLSKEYLWREGNHLFGIFS